MIRSLWSRLRSAGQSVWHFVLETQIARLAIIARRLWPDLKLPSALVALLVCGCLALAVSTARTVHLTLSPASPTGIGAWLAAAIAFLLVLELAALAATAGLGPDPAARARSRPPPDRGSPGAGDISGRRRHAAAAECGRCARRRCRGDLRHHGRSARADGLVRASLPQPRLAALPRFPCRCRRGAALPDARGPWRLIAARPARFRRSAPITSPRWCRPAITAPATRWTTSRPRVPPRPRRRS